MSTQGIPSGDTSGIIASLGNIQKELDGGAVGANGQCGSGLANNSASPPSTQNEMQKIQQLLQQLVQEMQQMQTQNGSSDGGSGDLGSGDGSTSGPDGAAQDIKRAEQDLRHGDKAGASREIGAAMRALNVGSGGSTMSGIG